MGIIIVSGGQTGVDRAALCFAVAKGLSYRGWTPAGGWAEDLPAPPGVRALYPLLLETESIDPAHRTSLNVEESDAVLVFTSGAASPGTEEAKRCAQRFGKPLFLADPGGPPEPALDWLASLGAISALNIAGPRESEAPGIEAAALAFLEALAPLLARELRREV